MKSNSGVWKDIIAVLNQGLSEMEITGYSVRRSNLPILKTRTNGMLLVDMIDSVNYGWQHHDDTYDEEDNILYHVEELIKTYEFQITTLEKPKMEDGDMSAIDVIEMMNMWLRSEMGIRALRRKGYGIYNPQRIAITNSTDDSDLYDKIPGLSFMVETVQKMTSRVSEVNRIIGIEKGE